MIKMLKGGPFSLNCREMREFEKDEVLEDLTEKDQAILIDAGWAEKVARKKTAAPKKPEKKSKRDDK